MLFILHTPTEPLDKYIENIVYYEGYNSQHKKNRLLPDGYIELIIDLDDTPKYVYDNNDFSKKFPYKKCWISGIRKEYITIDATQQSMMVITFKPGRAFPFFNFPLGELKNNIIHLDEVWGSKFLSTREKIIETLKPEQRIKIIEDYLYQIAKNRLAENHFIDYCIDNIAGAGDTNIIKRILKDSGYSHKHLVHLFNKYVGISPKYYYRILRFQKVLQTIGMKEKINWSQLIYDCGYYDQAHFIKEFRNFSGLNPTSYLNGRGEYLNYIPID